MITKEKAQEELKKRAIKELSTRLLEYFIPYVDPFSWNNDKAYKFKPFHKIITDALEAVLRKEKKKIMISVPPQHWKSTISTQRFPIFAHMKDPTQYIVSASYSWDLAKNHLTKARQVAESPQFISLWKPLNFTTNWAFEYTLAEWWWYYAVWVWWSLTGRPIDIGIIDDVHKDRLEYESDTIRNNTWDWYTSVFLSRLHKDSVQIWVMTRWWEDDLFWRILALEWDEWEVINIPVIQWNDTIFPERFPYDFIQKKRWVMWERDFQALYMWDPINEWGWDFRREYFTYFDEAPVFTRKYMFIDPAISQKESADYTAIVVIWITRDNHTYLLDIFRDKILPDQVIDKIIELAELHQVNAVWIETVQYQKMLALELKKQMIARNKMFHVYEMKPSWEKEARIRSVLQPRYSLWTVHHRKSWINVNEFESELLKFPNWKHDDMIDALASCIAMSWIEMKDIPEEVIEKDLTDDEIYWRDEVVIDFEEIDSAY